MTPVTRETRTPTVWQSEGSNASLLIAEMMHVLPTPASPTKITLDAGQEVEFYIKEFQKFTQTFSHSRRAAEQLFEKCERKEPPNDPESGLVSLCVSPNR
jgi:hypothetical protein